MRARRSSWRVLRHHAQHAIVPRLSDYGGYNVPVASHNAQRGSKLRLDNNESLVLDALVHDRGLIADDALLFPDRLLLLDRVTDFPNQPLTRRQPATQARCRPRIAQPGEDPADMSPTRSL